MFASQWLACIDVRYKTCLDGSVNKQVAELDRSAANACENIGLVGSLPDQLFIIKVAQPMCIIVFMHTQ